SSQGRPLMIIGSGKSAAIDGDTLLKRYFTEFNTCLHAGDTKLMVIGYSFSDDHVDRAIDAAVPTGLRMYLVNPAGLDVLDKIPRGTAGYTPGPLTAALSGVTTRRLGEIFGDDDLQRESLESFLTD